MKSYSQNQEDLIVLDYFRKNYNGKIGMLLDIGANDGTTLSNSKLMIENGWDALLVEPSSIYQKLSELHEGNAKVRTLNVAISNHCGELSFLESGAHIPNGEDMALVSTALASEAGKWIVRGIGFTKTTVEAFTFERMLDVVAQRPIVFDFISIDCEGMDWIILRQIDLMDVQCKCLCIEHNGDVDLVNLFVSYCSHHGLKEIHRNAENIIFAL